MPSWAVNLLSLHPHLGFPPLCRAMGCSGVSGPVLGPNPWQVEGVMNENNTSHSPASYKATCTTLCMTRGASFDPNNPPQMVYFSWVGSQLRRPVTPFLVFTPLCRLLGLDCVLGLMICHRIWRKVMGYHFCEEVTTTLASISLTLSCPLSFVHSDGSRCHVTSCPRRGPPGNEWGAASSQRPAGN